MSRVIGDEELKLHSKPEDCWIVVHGKVYDSTSYLNDHPGGVEIVTDLAGTDATEDYDDVGHSEEAHEILERLLIGVYDPKASMANGKGTAATTSSSSAPKSQPEAPAKAEPAAPSTLKTVNVPTASSSSSSKSKADVQSSKYSNSNQGQGQKSDNSDNSMMIAAGVVAAIGVGFVLYRRLAA